MLSKLRYAVLELVDSWCASVGTLVTLPASPLCAVGLLFCSTNVIDVYNDSFSWRYKRLYTAKCNLYTIPICDNYGVEDDNMRCAKVKRTELQRPKWQIYLTAPYLCGRVMEDGEK